MSAGPDRATIGAGQAAASERVRQALARRDAPGFQEQMTLLAELSGLFSHSLDIDDTLRAVIVQLAGYMSAEAASVFILSEDRAALSCRECTGPVDIRGLTLPADAGIVGKAVQSRTAQMVRDARTSPQFASQVDRSSGFTTHSLLCVPLVHQDRCLGAIELLNKRGGDLFDESDQRFCQALAPAAALAIHNAGVADALLAQERIRRELALAREIQLGLLPREEQGTDLPVAGLNVPALEVSGDFYDFFRRRDGLVYFDIADVSGKGANAALLMAQVSSLLHHLARKGEADPELLLREVNEALCRQLSRGMFITLISGFVDAVRAEVRFANAGHQPPLLHAGRGQFRTLRDAGPPLGVVPEARFPVTTLNLGSDSLYFVTDGITEARAGSGQVLGSAGLQGLIRRCADAPLHERPKRIVSAVGAAAAAQRDDITLLVIEMPERGGAAAPAPAPQRAPGQPPPGKLLASLQTPARAESLALVRALLRQTLSRRPPKLCNSLVLAVGEACTNIIEHAYSGTGGDFTLGIADNGGELVFLLEDAAPPMDLASIASRDLQEIRPGGLGVHFIRKIMDHCQWGHLRSGAGNYLLMCKSLSVEQTPAEQTPVEQGSAEQGSVEQTATE